MTSPFLPAAGADSTERPGNKADAKRLGKRKAGRLQPFAVAQIEDALLTLTTTSAVAGLSIPSIYRKVKSDPTFPKLIRLGRRCTRVRAGDLRNWIGAQAAAVDAQITQVSVSEHSPTGGAREE